MAPRENLPWVFFSAWKARESPQLQRHFLPWECCQELLGADPAMLSSCLLARAALRSLLPPSATPWSTFQIYP